MRSGGRAELEQWVLSAYAPEILETFGGLEAEVPWWVGWANEHGDLRVSLVADYRSGGGVEFADARFEFDDGNWLFVRMGTDSSGRVVEIAAHDSM